MILRDKPLRQMTYIFYIYLYICVYIYVHICVYFASAAHFKKNNFGQNKKKSNFGHDEIPSGIFDNI